MRLALILMVGVIVWQGYVCPPRETSRIKTPPERIISAFERPVEEVRRAVKKGIEEKGAFTQEDTQAGVMTGTMGTSKVSVGISQMDGKFVQIVVVVRDQAGVFEYEKASEVDRAICRVLR